MTPTEKDTMALAALTDAANAFAGQHGLAVLDARAHLASRIAELEMESAGVTAAYERFTAYTITHNGAMRYCSAEMRDAYAEMSARAIRAEAELAAVLADRDRMDWLDAQGTAIEPVSEEGVDP